MNTASIWVIFARLAIVALLLLSSILSPAQPVSAMLPATLMWVGPDGGVWSVASNWKAVEGTHLTPQNGDTVLFANGGTSQNDISGLGLNGMMVCGDDTHLTGNPLAILVQIYCTHTAPRTSGSAQIDLILVLPATVEIFVEEQDVLILNGIVSGAGGITRAGKGRLALNGANNFTGGLDIEGGLVTLNHNSAAGSEMIRIYSGSTLALGVGAASVANPVWLNSSGYNDLGGLRSVSGNHTLSGALILSNAFPSPLSIISLADEINLAGPITGDTAAGLLFNGGGGFRISGAQPNSYTGGLILPSGTLTLDKPSGVQAVTTSLEIGDGADIATVKTLRDNQLSPNTPVTLRMNGKLDLNGTRQTIGRLSSGNNPPCTVSLSGTSGAGELTINTNTPGFGYYFGDLTGQPTSRVLVTGSQMQDFDNNTLPFAGTIEVDVDGTAYLSNFRSTGPLIMHAGSAGGLFSGSSTGSLISEGDYFVVRSAGDLSPVTGSLLLNAVPHFDLQFTSHAGPALRVTGLISLGSAHLWPCYFSDYALALGQTRVLIQNDGIQPVQGTFAGLSEGQQTTLKDCMNSGSPGNPARISYQGGAGSKDVTITRLVPGDLVVLVVNPSNPRAGQPVQIQARLTTSETTGLRPNTPIAFYDGESLIGTAPLDAFGIANLSYTFANGSHPLTTRLTGDPLYADLHSEPTELIVRWVNMLPMVKR